MSGALISADDAFRLTLLLVPEPLAQRVFDLRDTLIQLSTGFHNDWLERRWLVMESSVQGFRRRQKMD